MTDDSMRRDREFIINSLDPSIAPRLSPAVNASFDSMPLAIWFPYKEVFGFMDEASDLTSGTIDVMIARCVKAEFLEVRGIRKRGVNTREYRTIELP